MAEAAAAEEEVEVLFFVGCLGSFDSRNQRTTMALARILQAAGINFAILGKEETCTGDPARRVGNEYLAQMMAMQTVETLNQYSFKKIVTACPHCFNAIKNEYPEIGGNYEVVHHSELISQLIAEGRITLDPASDVARGKVTYHDPCYLGRYNSVYDDPRSVVSALPGAELTEMGRNRNQSFCCGGGGGRLFMEETRGSRINRARVTEALETGAEDPRRLLPLLHDDVRGRHQRRRGERPPASARHRRTRRGRHRRKRRETKQTGHEPPRRQGHQESTEKRFIRSLCIFLRVLGVLAVRKE